MIDYIIQLLSNISPHLATFLIAILPIIELRGAIPIGMTFYSLPWYLVYFWAVLGNIVSAIIVFFFLEKVSGFLIKHSKFFERFFNWLFSRTRKKHKIKVERFKDFALLLFVAIPLPITGSWTGCLIAFVFGIPFKKALTMISLGVMIAGAIVLLATVGAISIL